MRTGVSFAGEFVAIGVAAAVGFASGSCIDDFHRTRHLERDFTLDTAMRRIEGHGILALVGKLIDKLSYVAEQFLQRDAAVAVRVGRAFQRTCKRVAERAAVASDTGNAHFRRLGFAIDCSQKRRLLEIKLGQESIGRRGDRHMSVVRDAIERHLAEAHFARARIDVARHAAAMTGIGNEQQARTPLLEPLEEVVEFRPDDALASIRPRS